MMMKFEQVILQLGEFGLYQKKVYYLLCYVMFVAAFQKMIWVFVAAKPLHRCRLPDDDRFKNVSASNPYYHLSNDLLNRSIPWDEKDDRWASCVIYVASNVTEQTVMEDAEADGGRGGSVRKCHRWVFDDSQYKSSVVTDFELVCDEQWLSAMIVSLQMGGEFMGSIILGIFSDKYGRKKIMVASALMHSTISMLTSFSSSIPALIAGRIGIGFWTPGVVLSAYVIGMEFVGPSKRAFAGIFTQYFFGLGYLLVAVAAYFVRDWRRLQFLLSVPSIVIVSYWWLVPESVRWMLTKNKTAEAMKVIRKAAKVNGKQLSSDLLDAEVRLQDGGGGGSSGTLLDLFRNPNLRRRTIVLIYCWFVNTCIYYGFSYNTSNLAGNDYVNFGLAAAVEFPAYTFCLLSLDRMGRRLPLCGAMVFGGFALFASVFVPSDQATVTVALAMLGKLSITISFAITYMLSSEVFPTTVRSASYGLSNTCSRVGSMLAPFMLLLNNVWKPLTPILFSTLAVTSGLLCLSLPETLSRDLPDTIADGEDYENSRPLPKYDEKDPKEFQMDVLLVRKKEDRRLCSLADPNNL